MKAGRRHYSRESWGETECRLDLWSRNVRVTDRWDRVTCQNCLSARSQREARKGFAQLQKMYREFVNYADEFQLKPGEVIR